VGDREVEQGAVGVRERGEDKGPRPLAEFIGDLVAEVRERRLPDGAGGGAGGGRP
jgi:hypothetical protein